MPATKTLQKFLRDNKDLINNNDFDELFRKAYNLPDKTYFDLIKVLNISGIDIWHNISHIPSHYFQYNRSIQEFIIPEGIEKINQRAFMGCRNLTKIIFPKSLKFIDVFAFYHCPNLEKIVFNGTKDQWIKEVAIHSVGNKDLLSCPVECSDGVFSYQGEI